MLTKAPFRVADDETQNPEICSVGNGKCTDINATFPNT